MKIAASKTNEPNWKEITVSSRVPKDLEKLQEIAHNIWWNWNDEATDLFNDIDPDLFKECAYNPVQFLERLDYQRMEEIVKDEACMKKLNAVYSTFRSYMDVKPDPQKPTIAYFSMEYGLTEILKIYSGGLGVLAGDYLKEASDSNVDMTAVGFLYRYGYFTQQLSTEGDQLAIYDPQVFNLLPIEAVKDEQGQQIVISVPYPDHTVYANLWRVNVGRVSLYLLDTDTDLNSEFDRTITHQLYGGDWENRLKQEYLLGIGGIITLKTLGIEKQVYHCNEGHAALINAERLVNYIQEKSLSFNEAMEVVKGSALYTVHTPVPAGHDSFDEGLFYKYMNKYPEKLGITWDDFIDLGRENPGNKDEKFSMSVFACNTCQEVNGVSWLHGKVSQEMFQPIWKGYFPEELHVSYVTNGVHLPTWAANSWKKLYEKTFGADYVFDQSNLNIWSKIYQVPDEEIWKTRCEMKNKLIEHIKLQMREQWAKNQSPSTWLQAIDSINPKALLIGFGRRFATYKRAHLLFTDLDRLAKIVNNANYPVQFLYTGKAHPADGAGQGLIKRIIEISRMPQFLGKIIFLENYDMRLAKRLVSGVDIWLNTPTRPLEASGTSGEKAQMNGVLNFSVLDGWWLEGYVKGAGWALTDKKTFDNQAYQDQLDALTIYSMLENEIVPMYYAKNSLGYSPEWIQTIKNSIAKITPRFTMKRMLDDYFERFYNKLATRGNLLKENNFAKAKEIAAWKERVVRLWDGNEVRSLNIPEQMLHNPQAGETYTITAEIDMKEEPQKSIGLELVVTYRDAKNIKRVYEVKEFEQTKIEGAVVSFKLDYRINKGGNYKFGIRMFPKNDDLPNRQNFNFVRWI
ncbi:MAG: alpha-glucan family phosphorylase [Prevotellaceae bacterium]|jgi:starch phosphorylase|nr:alpha-glucan family phosphorylase [Prevotellaceae bacterium]